MDKKTYYQLNKDKIKQKNKENREKINGYYKSYYYNNRTILLYARKHKLSMPEARKILNTVSEEKDPIVYETRKYRKNSNINKNLDELPLTPVELSFTFN